MILLASLNKIEIKDLALFLSILSIVMHPYCVEQIEKMKSRARWRSIMELSYIAGSKRWPITSLTKGRADTQNTEAERTPNQSEWSRPVMVASIG